MGKSRKNRKPHFAADLTKERGRKRARNEMVWGDHGFLRAQFSNLHALSDEMWRANQPSPRQISAHKAKRGIRTIINLRGVSTRGYYLLEREACAAEGIALVDYQVFSRDTPTRETVLGVRELFDGLAYPALMHCKSGADRAGLMSVLYLIARKNVDVSTAIEQLGFRYLHVKQGKTGMLDAFFQAALDAGADQPDSFFRWIAQDYDRMAVKTAFLARRQRLDLAWLLGRE